MSRQIVTIGYEVPGYSELGVGFGDRASLMDADILVVSPELFEPSGGWVSFTRGGGGCYDVASSKRFIEKISHLKKELGDHLRAGKSVFVFLAGEVMHTLSDDVSSSRKGENSYSTYQFSNYSFLPINLGHLTTASGNEVRFSGSPIFANFHSEFSQFLRYELYVEDADDAQVVYTGKDDSKMLGAVYSVGAGHIITLPVVSYNWGDYTEVREEEGREETYWNEKGLAFGNKLVECLIGIERSLRFESGRTPAPDWTLEEKFVRRIEEQLRGRINENNEEIERLETETAKLLSELEEEKKIKGLLFEQGTALEVAVIKALKILGYEAENYDDGELEIDQVIVGPEKHRFIGETEGKDTKDINITKFRQLVDALNADFAREEVEEKADGILFGNPQRLIHPEQRSLDFTEKCKSGALREKIALVRTPDLFVVATYLSENDDVEFKKACRDAIYEGLGAVVAFPEIPNQ